jgi:hypothetical protein
VPENANGVRLDQTTIIPEEPYGTAVKVSEKNTDKLVEYNVPNHCDNSQSILNKRLYKERYPLL